MSLSCNTFLEDFLKYAKQNLIRDETSSFAIKSAGYSFKLA